MLQVLYYSTFMLCVCVCMSDWVLQMSWKTVL